MPEIQQERRPRSRTRSGGGERDREQEAQVKEEQEQEQEQEQVLQLQREQEQEKGSLSSSPSINGEKQDESSATVIPPSQQIQPSSSGRRSKRTGQIRRKSGKNAAAANNTNNAHVKSESDVDMDLGIESVSNGSSSLQSSSSVVSNSDQNDFMEFEIKSSPNESQNNSEISNERRRKSSRLSSRTVKPTLVPSNGNTTKIAKLSGSPIIRENGRTSKFNNALLSTPPNLTSSDDTINPFIEPPLAEPTPIYTGLPLESGPTQKIRKDALWPSKARRSNRGSASTSREGSLMPQDDSDIDQQIESEYKKELKTNIKEGANITSDIRGPIILKIRPHRSSSRSSATNSTVKSSGATPKQSAKQRKVAEFFAPQSPLRASKRIKVISPKKSASTNLAPSTTTVNINGVSGSEDDPTKDNDDFCSSCGGPGVFICCETCPKSFHFTCCDPPLEEAPEDDWFCRECIAKRNPGGVTKWNDVGIFGQLLNQSEVRNPTVFALPRGLRDGTFIGVFTGDNGDYTDDSMKPTLSYTKANGAQIPGYNKNEDLEIDSLYSKDGTPYLCHKCGQSGLKHRTLSHCDYCPLVWHIDCLDEPMFGPKTIGTRWRCPNHVEELLPKSLRNRKRKFRDTAVIEPALQSHFLKLASLSDILIKYDDQPYLKQDKIPNLQDYLQFQGENFARKDKAYTDSRNGAMTMGDLDEDISPNYKTPDFFESLSNTSAGVGAKASSGLSKVLSITSENDTTNEISSFIYRVPERSIILDFITRVESDHQNEKEACSSTKEAILDSISTYDNRSRIETNEDDRNVVEALNRIKSQVIESPQPKSRLNFEELVQVALKEKIEEEKVEAQIHEDEIGDLIKIKKLMELKGKEALLEFLKS